MSRARLRHRCQLTLKIAPEDRSPTQELELLIDADGRASYSTGFSVTSCLSSRCPTSKRWIDSGRTTNCSCSRPRRAGRVCPWWAAVRCRTAGTSETAVPATVRTMGMRAGRPALAGRAASSMRNVWLEFVGPGEESPGLQVGSGGAVAGALRGDADRESQPPVHTEQGAGGCAPGASPGGSGAADRLSAHTTRRLEGQATLRPEPRCLKLGQLDRLAAGVALVVAAGAAGQS